MQIVIAWTEEEQTLVKAGRSDLGERHTFRTIQSPRVAMWVNDGTKLDLELAGRYASANGHRVFCYDAKERNPLARARRDILAEIR
jgi:hypothetical protein